MSLDAFAQLFNGREENSLSGEGYKQAEQWLHENEKTAGKKALACIVFVEKPSEFVITGKLRKNKDKGDDKGMLNDKILPFLPKLDMMPDDPKSIAKRANWGNFKLINLSMIRRVAYMAIEDDLLPAENKLVANWKLRWGNKPSEQDYTRQGWIRAAEATKRIRKDQLNLFLRERELIRSERE